MGTAAELVISLTDRVVRTYKWLATSATTSESASAI